MVAEKDNPLMESCQYTRPYTSCLRRIRRRTRRVWVVYESVQVIRRPVHEVDWPYTLRSCQSRGDMCHMTK